MLFVMNIAGEIIYILASSNFDLRNPSVWHRRAETCRSGKIPTVLRAFVSCALALIYRSMKHPVSY
jgi:hypothetical protein